MHIIHIAAELAPIAKVGGLADVVYGLSRETVHQGHRVDVMIPKYDVMMIEGLKNFSCEIKHLSTYYSGRQYDNSIWKADLENLSVTFIDSHHPKLFFGRGCIYSCEDDIDRFLYFSRAVVDFLVQQKIQPDVIHLHDWQTAVIAPLIKSPMFSEHFARTKVIHTIHNMHYQGRCAPYEIERVGLSKKEFYTPQKMQDSLYPEALNLLKGAIIYADLVTTVSPTYSREVMTEIFGEGLHQLLLKHQDKFSGILNGIDYDYWNPETDKHLPAHYSRKEIPIRKKNYHTVDRKGYIKKVLREKLGLDDVYKPIVGAILRLVPQKGVDIIQHAIESVVEKGGQFVLLGSSPIPSIDTVFHDLKHRYADHPHIQLILQHKEELAHWIYAGSDMFIIPSLFEPCGLTQMIALHYGTIPIVRRTGGLYDTIFDVDHSGKPFEQTTGYTFDEPTPAAFDRALERALDCWHCHPEKWRDLMVQGMEHDFSWQLPAKEYIKIYR